VSLLGRWTGAKPDDQSTIGVQPTVVKEWHRRHDDGSLGTAIAWSDGRFVGGHFEYRARAGGVQVGPRYPYPTLAEAFAGADAEARVHGHSCTPACGLWQEAVSSGMHGIK
jgi:hypothetical protein